MSGMRLFCAVAIGMFLLVPEAYSEEVQIIPGTSGIQEKTNPSGAPITQSYLVGCSDTVTWCAIEIDMPSLVMDFDGGTIRLVMQHETSGLDEVRVIDLHIGVELPGGYGSSNHGTGKFGWTRQSGGGEHSWILGDSVQHNIAVPWDWVTIVDYRWKQDNSVLGGDKIRIYAHPEVTARVTFKD